MIVGGGENVAAGNYAMAMGGGGTTVYADRGIAIDCHKVTVRGHDCILVECRDLDLDADHLWMVGNKVVSFDHPAILAVREDQADWIASHCPGWGAQEAL